MNTILLIGLIGLALLAFGLYQMRKVRSSASWPSALGTVVATSIREEFQQGDADTADSWTYTPIVEYEFPVDTRTFRGNRIRFDSRGYDRPAKAEAALEGFPLQSPVEVFYNPADPSDAVLERKSTLAWVFTALGGVILALAIAAAIRG